MMTVKRTFIRMLDRPGGRWLLSALATWYARRKTRRNMAVWYDDLWIRSLDAGVHVADTPRFDYFTSDIVSFPSLADGIVQASEDYWFHLYKPRAGDLIMDVGAGVGFDTLVFSRSVGPSGRVIAIEAHPITFRRLEKFCELNGLANATCLQVAMVDKARVVYIGDSRRHEANTTQLEPTGAAAFKIEGVTVDEICKRLRVDHIDLLKMNIEGAERLAIEGMTEILGKTRYVCIACHDFRANKSDAYSTHEAVESFLRRNHFRVVTRPDDARSYVRDHVHAVNTMM